MFSLTTDTAGCIPWSDSLASFIFEKMFARYPILNDHSLSVVILVKNDDPWEKELIQFAAQSHKYFFSRYLRCLSGSVGYMFTLGFCSGHDHTVGEFQPYIKPLCGGSMLTMWILPGLLSLSLSLSLCPSLLVLSLCKNK